jgi:hypothetical protein
LAGTAGGSKALLDTEISTLATKLASVTTPLGAWTVQAKNTVKEYKTSWGGYDENAASAWSKVGTDGNECTGTEESKVTGGATSSASKAAC